MKTKGAANPNAIYPRKMIGLKIRIKISKQPNIDKNDHHITCDIDELGDNATLLQEAINPEIDIPSLYPAPLINLPTLSNADGESQIHARKCEFWRNIATATLQKQP